MFKNYIVEKNIIFVGLFILIYLNFTTRSPIVLQISIYWGETQMIPCMFPSAAASRVSWSATVPSKSEMVHSEIYNA